MDKRRKNRSQEGLDRNVNRLKEYMSKLVLFPRKKGKPKKGDATQAEIEALKTAKVYGGGEIMPLTKTVPVVETAEVTAEMQEYSARKDYRMQVAYAYSKAKKACPTYGSDEE